MSQNVHNFMVQRQVPKMGLCPPPLGFAKKGRFREDDSSGLEKYADCRYRADKIPDLSGFHILVLDECEDSRLLIERMLRGSGAKFEFVSSGFALTQTPSLMDYDIVIMEILRPVGLALELIMAVRAQGYDRPVVGLTASLIRDQRQYFIENGFSEVILKPFHVQEFRDTVSRILRDVPHRNELSSHDEGFPRMELAGRKMPIFDA